MKRALGEKWRKGNGYEGTGEEEKRIKGDR